MQPAFSGVLLGLQNGRSPGMVVAWQWCPMHCVWIRAIYMSQANCEAVHNRCCSSVLAVQPCCVGLVCWQVTKANVHDAQALYGNVYSIPPSKPTFERLTDVKN